MPILPVIDLLIFSAWSVLSVGAVLKAIWVTTQYRPTIVGLGPLDCLIIAAVLLLFALALAGRTWVKTNEASGVKARASAITGTISSRFILGSPLSSGSPRCQWTGFYSEFRN